MDAALLRRLAARMLGLARKMGHRAEAVRLRLAAADYLEKAERAPGPAAQPQQTIKPDAAGGKDKPS
jgi:hypothetical protein